MPTWDPAVVECVQEKPGAVAVGTSFSMLTTFRGQRSRMRYTVTSWKQNEEVVIVGSSFALTSTERIAFRADGSETAVSWHATVRFRWLLAWLAPLLRSAILATGPAAQAGMLQAFAAGKHKAAAR